MINCVFKGGLISEGFSFWLHPPKMCQITILIIFLFKVWTFWETHKIWKKLPHGFDKSADLLSKRQNHEKDFFKFCVLLKKSELYSEMLRIVIGHFCLREKMKIFLRLSHLYQSSGLQNFDHFWRILVILAEDCIYPYLTFLLGYDK